MHSLGFSPDLTGSVNILLASLFEAISDPFEYYLYQKPTSVVHYVMISEINRK